MRALVAQADVNRAQDSGCTALAISFLFVMFFFPQLNSCFD